MPKGSSGSGRAISLSILISCGEGCPCACPQSSIWAHHGHYEELEL